MNRIFLIFLLLLPYFAYAQQNKADDIVGYYYNIDPFTGDASQIYIYKTNKNKYEGKVCWVDKEEKKKFLNLVFLKDLEFNNGKNEWQNGVVKYPGKNGTYAMTMKFESETRLKVRGYWGVALLGKTVYWHKEKEKRN